MGLEETKAGYYYSLALHIGIAVALVVFAFVGQLFKKPPEQPVIFQMMEPVPDAPLQANERVEAKPEDTIAEPKVEKIKPIDLPEPEPDQPEPAPEKPQPKDDTTPQPKAVDKPKPQPPKKMSLSDFRKKNPEKKQTQTTSTQRKPVKIDRISANTSNLDRFAKESNISVKGGASSAMKNALGAYAQYINAVAKRNWIMPDSITGMELSCTIIFRVSATGGISAVRILKSSGNSDFDESAVKLFRGLRLDPPPDNEPHNITLLFTTEK